MAITMQYRVTVRCDTCRKADTTDTVGQPPMTTVPLHWIQAQPPGSRDQKEFCSIECMAGWRMDVMPWDDEETV
jgi:hypothetical protein